jgi:hypothetical protein
MPFLDFGITPSSGVKGPYADYDTALAALRADAGASDGDVYELDSGDQYVAQSIGSSFGLIPAKWVDQIQEDMSNASGSALRIAGESKATTLARGWTELLQNGGTITESGDALRLDSGTTGSGLARLQFVPTSGLSSATGFLIGVTLQIVNVGSAKGFAQYVIRDGTKRRWLHLDNNSTEGDLHWAGSQTTTAGESNANIGTNKSTVFTYMPASGEYAGLQIVGDPRARCVADYSDFQSAGALSDVVFFAADASSGGASNQVVIDIFDVFAWEVTP